MGFLEVLRVFLSVFLIFFFFKSIGRLSGFSLENWMIDSIRCLTSVLMVYIFFFSLCNYGRFDRIFD